MSNPRLVWYALAFIAVLVIGYAMAVAGLTLCSPPPLEGDTVWTWNERLREAFGIASGRETRCFLRVGAGEFALALASWSGLAALAVGAAAILWEGVGRKLRREIRRRRGGHYILAGEPGEIEALASAVGATGAAFMVRNRPLAVVFGRHRPFADVTVLADRRQAKPQMERLGGPTARFIVAATDNDLANGEIAEAALAENGVGDLLVRLENSSVRALKSDALRRLAERKKRGITVISLSQIQARQALTLAMPGRYRLAVPGRVHIAICGSGPMMQETALLLARQGYGLEDTPPLFSLMRTGHGDFSAGALERLLAAETLEVHAVTANGESGVDIDRTFTAIALAAAPLSAVHCCGDEEGSALALALRLERVFVDLQIPVPPIVVHGDGPDEPGDTGMVRVARRPTLAEARAYATQIDRRARAFHDAYLDGQRKARGDAFGTLPGECDWQVLPERLRDDNRYSADHIDYKLARAGFLAAPGEAGAALDDDDIEILAPLEHARWMASKSLGGTRYGAVRDDKLMLHPDMKPYCALDEEARRKDRDQIEPVPAQLASGGEVLLRLESCALPPAGDIAKVASLLQKRALARPAARPMAAVAIATVESVVVVEAVLAAGLPVEVFVTGAPEHVFGDEALRRRAAAILRQAWRIQVVSGQDATAAIEAKYPGIDCLGG